MICIMFLGNKTNRMLQIFESSHSQMANSFHSAHNHLLLFFNFEEQCKSTGAGNEPVHQGLKFSFQACLQTDLFLRLPDLRFMKQRYIAKSKHYVFFHKSWHILHQWTIAWNCYNALAQILAHKINIDF